jgi:N-acetylglucosamine-6-phosphate deacetylase
VAVDALGSEAGAWLAVEAGVITARGHGDSWRQYEPREPGGPPAAVRDGRGSFVTPGFIDLHVHGGGGAMHEDGLAGMRASIAFHRAHGTTRSLISLVSGPPDALAGHLAQVAELTRADPRVLGSHLEGPFLDPARRGAHNPAYLIAPDPALIEALCAAADGTLRQVTVDPAQPGGLAAVTQFVAAGVIAAVGHTQASYARAAAAFDAGARLLTHAFNAMPGIGHRAPGPVLAAIDAPQVTAELILDAIHVDPRVGALLFTAAAGRVALVTDAIAAAGQGDGTLRLGGLEVTVAGGRATIAGTSTLAGSTLTQDQALVRGLAAGLSMTELVTALTWTPARVLGISETVGLLRPGYVADLVQLGPAHALEAVYLDGRPLGSAAGEPGEAPRRQGDPA